METSILRQYQTISFSALPEFRQELVELAREEGMTLSEFIREALRRQMELKKFKHAQALFSERARQEGLRNEDDAEQIVDEVRLRKGKNA